MASELVYALSGTVKVKDFLISLKDHAVGIGKIIMEIFGDMIVGDV